MCVLDRVRHFATPWTAAPQVPLSMELCGQGYWSGYLLPPPGGLPNPGIVSRVSCIGRWILTTTSPGKPHEIIYTLEQSSELHLPYRGGNRRREGKKLVPGHRGAERQSRDSASTRRRPITHFPVRQLFLPYSR